VSEFEEANLVSKLRGNRDRFSTGRSKPIEGRKRFEETKPESATPSKPRVRKSPSAREIAAELAALGYATSTRRSIDELNRLMRSLALVSAFLLVLTSCAVPLTLEPDLADAVSMIPPDPHCSFQLDEFNSSTAALHAISSLRPSNELIEKYRVDRVDAADRLLQCLAEQRGLAWRQS
jgi:hypothetical protein